MTSYEKCIEVTRKYGGRASFVLAVLAFAEKIKKK